MKLKQYMEELQKLYDEVGDLELVYATDYLANDFEKVGCGNPSHGYWDFYREADDKYQPEKVKESDEHVVCINWG